MSERPNFIYGRIAFELLYHETTAALCEEDAEGAIALYVFAIVFSRFKRTDGFLTKPQARGLLNGKGAKFYEILVRVGWFIERADGSGIDVWNYAKFNDTNEQIEASKRGTRQRMQRKRERDAGRDAGGAGDVTRDIPVTDMGCHTDVPISISPSERDKDPGLEGSEQEEQVARQRTPGGDESGVHRAAPLADPAGEFEIGERWRDGVAEGSGVRPARPMGGELRKLVALVYEQASPGGGIEGQRARSQTAFDLGRKYGEAHRDQIRNVHRFADWVGSGCPAVAPRSGRTAFARQPLAPARAPPSFTAEDALREGEETMRRMAKGEF